jgi:hypothetical protein
VNEPELVKLKGLVRWELRDPRGELLDLREIPNIITAAGKAGVAGLLNGFTTGNFKWIALGTGTNAASTTDVTLQAEITTTSGGLMRAMATPGSTTTIDVNDTMKLTYTFTASTSYAVTESGVLSTSSSGPLLSRQTYTQIIMTSGDTLAVTWQISVA